MSKASNRGVLYVTIAVLSDLLKNAKPEMTWFEILLLFGGAILSGLITLRAFIDQTPMDEKPQDVKVVNPPAEPVQTQEAKQTR
jgi:hypothetical protein